MQTLAASLVPSLLDFVSDHLAALVGRATVATSKTRAIAFAQVCLRAFAACP
jgi:hypothetical protein